MTSSRPCVFPSGRARRATGLVGALALLAVLGGCSDDEPSGTPPPGSEPPGSEPPEANARSGLRTLDDGDTFIAALRDALIAQRSGGDAYPAGVPEAVTDPGAPALTAGANDGADADAVADAVADADADADAGAGAGGGGGGGGDVTGTNVQEAGVDERDRVKSDGRRLYVLDVSYGGHDGGAEPWVDGPTAEPAPADDGIDGGTLGVDPIGTSPPFGLRNVLRILDMDRETPDARPVADLEIDLEGRDADGFYLYESGAQRFAVLTAAGNGHWESWDESVAFRGDDSLVTRIDVTQPSADAAQSRLRIDGRTIASRRIGGHLFLATRFYPNVDGASPYEQDEMAWRDAVLATDDAALLPGWSLDGGEARSLIDPADCFVAERPEGREHYTPDIVTLSLIDLRTLQPIDSECYLGASETLYASPDSVYLATTRWDYSPGIAERNGVEVSVEDGDIVSGGSFYRDPRVDTDLHRFDIGEDTLDYVGSGSVRGHLGWNPQRKPYRMSARDGTLRIATMSAEQGPDVSPVILSVLEADGEGVLERIAELPSDSRPAPIGKPGEQLYASRFVGDRAYLVTFRQTDPLYVIDLSDPRDPQALGELEISGYSDWLQPIGDRHLLGIGKEAVATPGSGDGRGGLTQGVKLALFDVGDPRAPREVQSVLIGERGSESDALRDARAITVQPATAGRSARIAFGVDVHGTPGPQALPSPSRAGTWQPWSFSGLYGFDVSTGADAGLTPRGILVAESASGDGQGYPSYGQDRSVIAGDAVYYVRGAQVRVARWGDFANATAPR